MKRVLVVHGRDDEQGRALLVISALYHCAQHLQGWRIRFVDVNWIAVELAGHALAYDTGLEVELVPDPVSEDGGRVLDGAALYVGVAFDDERILAASLATARGVRHFTALQFPPLDRMRPELVTRLAAAHDPVQLAEAICTRLPL